LGATRVFICPNLSTAVVYVRSPEIQCSWNKSWIYDKVETSSIFPIYENPGDEVTLDMSMEPAIISGTISTLADTNSTIENYTAQAYIWIPELNINFSNYNSAYSLSEPGIPGRDYTLLVASGFNYNWSINTRIDGINYHSNTETVTAPASGATLDKDFTVDVTAATVSGTAILQGMDVYNTSIYGYAYDPSFRYNTTNIDDINTGAYTLMI